MYHRKDSLVNNKMFPVFPEIKRKKISRRSAEDRFFPYSPVPYVFVFFDARLQHSISY